MVVSCVWSEITTNQPTWPANWIQLMEQQNEIRKRLFARDRRAVYVYSSSASVRPGECVCVRACAHTSSRSTIHMERWIGYQLLAHMESVTHTDTVTHSASTTRSLFTRAVCVRCLVQYVPHVNGVHRLLCICISLGWSRVLQDIHASFFGWSYLRFVFIVCSPLPIPMLEFINLPFTCFLNAMNALIHPLLADSNVCMPHAIFFWLALG